MKTALLIVDIQSLRFEEWEHLRESGAALTAVLVAQERNPDKLIRLEPDPSSQGVLHVHEAV